MILAASEEEDWDSAQRSYWIVDAIVLAYKSLGLQCPYALEGPLHQGNGLLLGLV